MALSILARQGVLLPHDTWLPLALLVLVAVFLEVIPVELPNGTQFTLGSAVYFVAFLSQGTGLAVWVVVVTVLASSFLTKIPYYKAFFNGSQYVVSLVTAAYAFALSGGDVGASQLHDPLPVIVFILVDFVVNTGLLSIVLWQVTGESVYKVWKGLVSDAYLGHFATMAMGLLAAELFEVGATAILVIAVILLFLQRLFASYFQVVRRSEGREQLLRTILNSTDNGVIMVNPKGEVVHANERASEFLQIPLAQLQTSVEDDLALPGGERGTDGEFIVRGEVDRLLRYSQTDVPDGPDQGMSHVLTLTDITKEREATRKLRAWDATIRTLVAAVDARDEYTHGHSARVSRYAVELGIKLGLSERELEDLRFGTLLHDIGKIGIPDSILRKGGALTDEERLAMMEHPTKGAAILSKADAFKSLIPVVLYHHEWYGGGGYPTGRPAKEMPLGARIAGVADAFDAMTSDRHYRASLDLNEALDRLIRGKGTQFDPELVDLFVEMAHTGEIVVPGSSHEAVAPIESVEQSGTERLGIHLKELQVVHRIAAETRTYLDLDAFLPKVAEILAGVLGEGAYYFVFGEQESGELEVHAPPQTGQRRLTLDDLGCQVYRSGESMLLTHFDFDVLKVRSLYPESGCAVGVPLRVEGEVIGALCAESERLDAFSRETIYLLEAVAGQVASTVQIARYHEKVRQVAFYDGLTGVYNHTYFYEEAERLLRECMRHGVPLSLAVFDVNELKQVNDRFGHLAGDQLLTHYADLLKVLSAGDDMVARYGGDEFVVLMRGITATAAADRISSAVDKMEPSLQWNSVSIPLRGMAWGVASYPDDGNRIVDLIDHADKSMYSRKRGTPTASLTLLRRRENLG